MAGWVPAEAVCLPFCLRKFCCLRISLIVFPLVFYGSSCQMSPANLLKGLRLRNLFFLRIRCFLSSPLLLLQRYLWDSFPLHQRVLQRQAEGMIDFFLRRKTHLHFGRMHVHVYLCPVYPDVKERKRKPVLHQKPVIRVLNGLSQNPVLYKTSVYKIVFKIPVCSCHARIADKPVNRHQLCGLIHRNQLPCQISSEDLIHNFLQVPVSAGIQPALAVGKKFERNLRMGQRQFFHHMGDMVSLCHSGFQKFSPRRRVKEKIPDNHGSARRRSDLLKFDFFSALNPVPHTRQGLRRLGNALHTRNGGYAGESFAAKSKCGNLHQIVHRSDFAGGMPHKGFPDLIRRNSSAVVRDPDKAVSSVLDFDGNGSRGRVNRVLRKLLDHGSRSFHHLSGGNFVNGCFIQ